MKSSNIIDIINESTKILTLDEMMNLYNNTNNFDYTDEDVGSTITRTFNYKLDITELFLQRGARNFRGTVYDLYTKKLLALPFYKFFNYNQNTFSDKDRLSKYKITGVFEKVDGSLVYFYKVNEKLMARTKRSCTNYQSIKSLELVNQNPELKEFIIKSINFDYTPMFEFISPSNNLVVEYDFETLCFLGLRHMITGKLYMPNSNMIKTYNNPIIFTYPLKRKSEIKKLNSISNIIAECKKDYKIISFSNFLKNIGSKLPFLKRASDLLRSILRKKIREGYVVEFTDPLNDSITEIVKFKRLSYLNIFKLKDSIRSESLIVQSIFNETIDDLISELNNNEIAKKKIKILINCVDDTWNRWIKEAKSFWLNNKDLSRKDYAIKAKKELESEIFSFAMKYYIEGNYSIFEDLQHSYIKYKKWNKSKFYMPSPLLPSL